MKGRRFLGASCFRMPPNDRRQQWSSFFGEQALF
jgi:hypothetical protein